MGFSPTATRESLVGNDLKRFLTHSAEGVGLLATKPYITPRVLALVADHEEFGEGRGYPEKKWITRLSLPSQILNLANAFDTFCMANKMEPKQALDPFFEKNADFFDLDHMNVLVTLYTATK